MDQILRHIIPHLPPDLQALYLNPPSLSDPSSFLPIIRTILPYTKYVVVLLAFYIVYSTTMSILGYFSRFLRFTLKVGPLLALAGWVMANSGQGGVEELVQAAQEWMGLSRGGHGHAGAREWSPGIAGLANMFGRSNTNSRNRNTRRRSGSGDTGGIFGGGSDPISSRTRSSRKGNKRTSARSTTEEMGDVFSDILNSATGSGGHGADWQDSVQGYVRRAVAKASGLDWLFGHPDGSEDERGRTGTGRSR